MSDPNSDDVEVKDLEPRAIFGFVGKVISGLNMHPDGIHLIYPLGNKIGIVNLSLQKHEYISGHSQDISCINLSRSGRYIASGQKSQMGFRSYLILWDWETRKELGRHDLHKVLVQSVCFTANDDYAISIGGEDDGAIIVYDVKNAVPICRAVASKGVSGIPMAIAPLNNNSDLFITAGDQHLRIWTLQNKKLDVVDVNVGKFRRIYNCLDVDKNDEFVFLGTMTGDVIKIRLNCCQSGDTAKRGEQAVLVGALGKAKKKLKSCDRYVHGVRSIFLIGDGLILIGTGDGVVELVEELGQCYKDYPDPTWPDLKMLKRAKVNGGVTSIEPKAKANFDYFIGTNSSEIYLLNIKTFDLKLLTTCHRDKVNDIAFPVNNSLVFASAGYESIRIWSTKRLQELLRIIVYNFTCHAVAFAHDGTCLVSAWDDGVLRSFTPITGRLIFAITNAHNKGCCAVAISSNGRVLVSGGIEGQVRVWKIEPLRQSLIAVLKDHSGPISSLHFNNFDNEVVSACTDGFCVIWDINRLTRKQVITANTQFTCARYFPTGAQILTSGADGRIGYWMVYNGGLIRELGGAEKTSINSVSIDPSGDYFAAVGNDQIATIWDYNRGVPICRGNIHASAVTCCAYSPCGQFFVSGSKSGSVIIWDIPKEYWPKTSTAKTEESKVVRKPEVQSKVVTSSKPKSIQNQENINGLPKSRLNKGVLCTECPAVNKKLMPDVNEICNMLPSN